MGGIRPLQGRDPGRVRVPKALPWAIALRRVAAGLRPAAQPTFAVGIGIGIGIGIHGRSIPIPIPIPTPILMGWDWPRDPSSGNVPPMLPLPRSAFPRPLRLGRWFGGLLLGAAVGSINAPTGYAASPAPAPLPGWERAKAPEPRLLPGSSQFHFSLYSAPGDVAELASLVQVLKDKHLASAFDPGPSASAASRPTLEYLARLGWPVILYPPDGGRMQVQGGTSVLQPADEAAVRVLDQAGVFNAIQLGEWGYHFHRLRSDAGWWKAVLGPDFEAQKGRFLKPVESMGYDPRPTTRRECYDQLRDYFLWHRQAKGGRLISVTGHSHYEAYAAEWGASVIGLEVGENIGFTQSKFAFARGASRQWNLPWTVQVSPWFGNAVTTRGPLDTSGATAQGLEAGHSLSLYLRMWHHAWFAGAAMVTPENSINSFFTTGRAPWELTEHGQAAADCFRFLRSHDRGNPHTPLLVVLDHLSGYNGYTGLTWGILPPTPADHEIRDLLEGQLYHRERRLAVPGNPPNPEANYLQPTRHGELADVVLSTATGAFLSRYPVVLLTGEIEFNPRLVHELILALEGGSRLLVQPRHFAALPAADWQRLQAAGAVEVLTPWVNPETQRPAAIPEDRLERIAREFQPIEVLGDPVQYQINRNGSGWVIELVNNDGVIKSGRTPAKVFPEVVAQVELQPRFTFRTAREWLTGRAWPTNAPLRVEIPPGESRFVELQLGTP
jgi:hypothetical protein